MEKTLRQEFLDKHDEYLGWFRRIADEKRDPSLHEAIDYFIERDELLQRELRGRNLSKLRELHTELNELENPPVSSWITSDDRIRIQEIKNEINKILGL